MLTDAIIFVASGSTIVTAVILIISSSLLSAIFNLFSLTLLMWKKTILIKIN